MNIFIDTNVILENFIIREDYTTAHLLFQRLQEQKCQLYMSVGSFYTMIFLVDKYLKKECGLTGEDRVWSLRQIMTNILQAICVAEHDNSSLLRAINNTKFKDIEDSCQYELAEKAGCKYLLTFNTSDYPTEIGASVQVMTPQQYLGLSVSVGQ